VKAKHVGSFQKSIFVEGMKKGRYGASYLKIPEKEFQN
jgi:hypothetical protein